MDNLFVRRVAGLFLSLALVLAVQGAPNALADDLPTLRIGVLKFGTVNWELDVIRHHGLDRERGFQLEVVPFAGKQATSTALLGEAVDGIVTDLIWAQRQRAEGFDLRFVPFSRMVGGVMTKGDGDLSALKGQRLGIAGGPLDKNWLLLRLLVQERHGFDPAETNDLIFGAPPLLSAKFSGGELDTVVTFWHFAARLEAAGHRRLIDVAEILSGLEKSADVPMLGYVFGPDTRAELIAAFRSASTVAKQRLATDDAEWARLEPLMRLKAPGEAEALRNGFRAGAALPAWNQKTAERISALFDVLATTGGPDLVGKATRLDPALLADLDP